MTGEKPSDDLLDLVFGAVNLEPTRYESTQQDPANACTCNACEFVFSGTGDENERRHSVDSHMTSVSQQRCTRRYSTASSEATSHTSDNTLTRIEEVTKAKTDNAVKIGAGASVVYEENDVEHNVSEELVRIENLIHQQQAVQSAAGSVVSNETAKSRTSNQQIVNSSSKTTTLSSKTVTSSQVVSTSQTTTANLQQSLQYIESSVANGQQQTQYVAYANIPPAPTAKAPSIVSGVSTTSALSHTVFNPNGITVTDDEEHVEHDVSEELHRIENVIETQRRLSEVQYVNVAQNFESHQSNQVSEQVSYSNVYENSSAESSHKEVHSLSTQENSISHHITEISQELVHEDAHGNIISRQSISNASGVARSDILSEHSLVRSPITDSLVQEFKQLNGIRHVEEDDDTTTAGSVVGIPTAADDSDSDDETIITLRSIVQKEFDSNNIAAIGSGTRTQSVVSHATTVASGLATNTSNIVLEKVEPVVQVQKEDIILVPAVEFETVTYERAVSEYDEEEAYEEAHEVHEHSEHLHSEIHAVEIHEEDHTDFHEELENKLSESIVETNVVAPAIAVVAATPISEEQEHHYSAYGSTQEHENVIEERTVQETHTSQIVQSSHTSEVVVVESSHQEMETAHEGVEMESIPDFEQQHEHYLEDHIQQAIGTGATVSSQYQYEEHTHNVNEDPIYDEVPEDQWKGRTFSSASQEEEFDTPEYVEDEEYVQKGDVVPEPFERPASPSPSEVMETRYMDASRKSTLRLVPHVVGPKVTEALRSVSREEVLRRQANSIMLHNTHVTQTQQNSFIQNESQNIVEEQEQEYDDVYECSHDGEEDHTYEEIYDTNEQVHETLVYADSVSSQKYTSVKKRDSDYSTLNEKNTLSEEYILSENVRALRSRFENGNINNHVEDEEIHAAIQHLDTALASKTNSIVGKSRSGTASTVQGSHISVGKPRSGTAATIQESKASKSRSGTVATAVSGAKQSSVNLNRISTNTITTESKITSETKTTSTKTAITNTKSTSSSKRASKSGKSGKGTLTKSRTSTLQSIDEYSVPKPTALPLEVVIGPPVLPILQHTPITSPNYSDKHQSVRVVKSVRQFVQQWGSPDFVPPHAGVIIAPKSPVSPVAPKYEAAPSIPVRTTVPQQRRESVMSDATSVSVHSSVSQKSALSVKSHVSCASNATAAQSAVTDTTFKSSKVCSHCGRCGKRAQKSVKTSKPQKRSSVDSNATLTGEPVKKNVNAADVEPEVTEVKVRAETVVLTKLTPVSQRRTLFEDRQSGIKRNFSINRKNIECSHLPPMVNLLD